MAAGAAVIVVVRERRRAMRERVGMRIFAVLLECVVMVGVGCSERVGGWSGVVGGLKGLGWKQVCSSSWYSVVDVCSGLRGAETTWVALRYGVGRRIVVGLLRKEGCAQCGSVIIAICVEGLARLWGRSGQGGCRCGRILSGYVKIIDARYLHKGRDMSRVLVGMKTVIIPPPLGRGETGCFASDKAYVPGLSRWLQGRVQVQRVNNSS